jgi:hypothetical protein
VVFGATESWHLTPDEARGKERTVVVKERRKAPRFNVHHPVRFKRKDRRKDCRSIDISLGGIKIETDGHVLPDDVLELTLLVRESMIKAKGKVVYVEELPDGNFHAGIVFEEMSDEGRDALTGYFSEIMSRGSERPGILKKKE